MEEALRQAWDNLFGRVDGPMSFRLIIQPVVATFLAIRAGWTDAREGRPIFFWTLARDPIQTRSMHHDRLIFVLHERCVQLRLADRKGLSLSLRSGNRRRLKQRYQSPIGKP